MTTETKRDLDMDLAFCAETEPTTFVVGPTTSEGTSVLSSKRGRLVAKAATEDIAEFMSEAREGWPHAIQRAITAEAEVERRKHSYRLLLTCYDGQSARAAEYYAEIQRLRAVLERMDDRKNPMIPRSQMVRMVKEALDYDAS